MVGPVKFKNTPVEVYRFSFFLDIIFDWKHQQEYKQFITHIVTKQRNSLWMKQCPTGNFLANTSQKLPKTTRRIKKFLFITGSSALPVLVRRWITRANCDKDLLISPAFVGKPHRDFNQAKSKDFLATKSSQGHYWVNDIWNDMKWYGMIEFESIRTNQTGPKYNKGIAHNK